MDTNCCIFTGRLTKNAEQKLLPNGNVIVSFSLGFSEPRKSKEIEGQHEYYSNYINCVMFGNYGKALFPMLVKGQEVTVTTRLHQNRWTKDGKNFSSYDFVVNNAIIQRPPKGQVGNAKNTDNSTFYSQPDLYEPQEIENAQ